ncbi:ArnT family glycosyltransferase [Thalassoroseus pseudoceratinae]|uniref:ArnT family glycosyltransferase n=1 Tax=Thalassoroseus pseudoceratinae TaxID=2713176 RepID=UPI00141E3314|nr:glycosyltransferase family 39 protein [Thalassoroseus pseudoceratinae]
MRWVERHPLLTVLLVAGSLRLTAAFGVQWYLDDVAHRAYLIAGDADGYWQLAETIVNGEPYEIYDPPRRVLRMPGFPVILAAAMKLGGGSPLFVRIVLAAIGTAACGLTFCLGRELTNATTGLLAGLLVALSPLQVGFSVLILSETTFAVPMIASLWAFTILLRTDWSDQPVRGIFVASGVGISIGLAVLIRPTWLPMALVFAGVCVLTKRFRPSSLLHGVVVIGSTVLVLLPWTIRNWQVTGRPIMTTLWAGPSLYDGLNPHATGASDMRFLEDDGLLESLSEDELNRHYWQAAWQYAQENPGRSVVLAFRKVGRLWSPWLNAEAAQRWFVQVPVVLTTLFLFGSGLVGFWDQRRNLLLLGITVGPALFLTAVHTLFVGSVRYRLPMEFPLAVLAAIGVQSVYCSFPKRQPEVAQ